MASIRSPKRRQAPKVKPIDQQILSANGLKPIQHPQGTYSQSQKLRVLTFLEHHRIPLRLSGECRKPTQQEASDMCHIPRRTISTWVKRGIQIEGVGKNSQIKREVISGNIQRVFWSELEEQLHREFLEWWKAGRSIRQGWFRIQSQFLFQSLYLNVNSSVFRFSNSWFRAFPGCHHISFRSITKKAQKVPEDYKPLIENCLRYNSRNS